MKESKVLRKMEYEERLRRRQIIEKSAFLLLSAVIIAIAVWYGSEILFRERSPEGLFLQKKGEHYIEVVMVICLPAFILDIVYFIWNEVKPNYEEKITEFNDLLREEEFFQYLGNQKLEVELQLRMASEDFIETIKNQKIKYYVQREGIDSLYMTAYDGSKEVWHETVDYEFFDLYFKEIIHHEAEEIAEN